MATTPYDMMTINIDLETLGVSVKDQVYTGAIYSNTNGIERSSQSFFNIDNSNYPNNMPLEEYLKTRHSSLFFGEKQQERGSLKGWAESTSRGTNTSISEYVSNILEMHKQGGGGSILLAQNLQFENRALSSAYLSGNIDTSFTNLTKEIVNRSEENPFSFLEPKNLSALNWDRWGLLADNIRPAYIGKDTTTLNSSLDSYFEKSMNIIDEYEVGINKAKMTNGIALVDLMDYSKAVYAHGARQGLIDPRMLQYGNKVEYLAKTLLGEEEQHEALSDAKQQDRLFKILSKEVDNIRKGGKDYTSPIVTKLAEGFEKEAVVERQVKSSAVSFIREFIEKTGNTNKGLNELKKEALGTFDYRNRFLAQTGTLDGFNYNSFRGELDSLLESVFSRKEGEKQLTTEKLLYKLEREVSDMSVPIPKESLFSDLLDKLPKNTNKAIGAGALALGTIGMGTIMFGGNKEEQQKKKYNTYDELYNNQYYGSAFADWQNRNNAHRMS